MFELKFPNFISRKTHGELFRRVTIKGLLLYRLKLGGFNMSLTLEIINMKILRFSASGNFNPLVICRQEYFSAAKVSSDFDNS